MLNSLCVTLYVHNIQGAEIFDSKTLEDLRNDHIFYLCFSEILCGNVNLEKESQSSWCRNRTMFE